MRPSDGTLAASIRDLADEDRRRQNAHPEPDELLDYHAGRISDDAKERVQDHLATCRSCAKAVLDMAMFPDIEPEDPGREVSSEQIATDLQALQRRLDGEARLENLAPFEKPGDSGLATPRVYALAATFVAACLGLALWNASLRQEVRELRRPRFNVATTSLQALDDAGVRSAGGETVKIVEGEQILLFLPLFWPAAETVYDVTLLDSSGAVILRQKDLRQTTGETANILLPNGALAAGEYRIRISLRQDVEDQVFKEFLLTIE